MRRYLVGAGIGNAIGGLIGIAILPLGWWTVLAALISIVGAYIAQAVWHEYYSDGFWESLGE